MAGAPGWYVVRRTAPVVAGDPRQGLRRFRLTAIAVTVGVVFLVLSMIRAHWSEELTRATGMVAEAEKAQADMMEKLGVATDAAPSFNAELASLKELEANRNELATTMRARDQVEKRVIEMQAAAERSETEIEGLRTELASANGQLGQAAGAANEAERARQAASSQAGTRRSGASSPGTEAAARSMLRPNPPIQKPGRPQDTSATVTLQARPDPVLPDEFALLPLESLEVLEWSTAERQSRRRPVADAPSMSRLQSAMGASPSLAQKYRVRYFSARDRAASQRLVEELRRFFASDTSLAPEHASDFTHYIPKPRPGTVEVWLPTS